MVKHESGRDFGGRDEGEIGLGRERSGSQSRDLVSPQVQVSQPCRLDSCIVDDSTRLLVGCNSADGVHTRRIIIKGEKVDERGAQACNRMHRPCDAFLQSGQPAGAPPVALQAELLLPEFF